MRFAFPPIRARSVGLGLLLAGAAAGLAFAQTAAAAPAPVPNKGDTAWMLVSTALVLMMSVPGLALFYGGLVRTKNMASVLSQVFAIVALVSIIWVVYGYSLAFTEGSSTPFPIFGVNWNAFFGGFNRAFLKGMDASSTAATFSNGVVIPEFVYMAFQMTFACITPALIIGSFAERIKFSSLLVFITLWVTFIYFPIAHAVWYWAGPDAVADAAKALAAATDDAAKATAQANLDAVNSNAGFLFQLGALDFAGGTVVHINAGIAGFVGCLVMGKRIGFPREVGPPHSVTMSMIGASLLWVGWFGFNAGSNLESNGTTALAFVNTFVATSAATLSWMLVEWALKGKPSLLGIISGAVAGLVAVTPASGFAGPMGSVVLGLAVGAICFFFVDYVKKWGGYDDSLDVFGVHCIGGIVGAIATGILVAPALGGVGLTDYTIKPGEASAGAYDMATQVTTQLKAVAFTLLYSGIGSFILYKLVDLVMGLRVKKDAELEGLDITSHGERAYNP
ncbi:ammonium transporter [Methylocella silvestris BL2]|uniref:Ammonium transporter n=1 Tax=Methylocella silvestris (strain DSM 15510 / CIP 108128 / LMG 27833 / NCIMB 13906 / BL2) TaxID=395965 RepID=B8ENL9_METSB|nr:ammonium transporter [Methylocella silvestris BL2]